MLRTKRNSRRAGMFQETMDEGLDMWESEVWKGEFGWRRNRMEARRKNFNFRLIFSSTNLDAA